MGEERQIISDEFKDDEEIDTCENIKHNKDSKRDRKELKEKGKKSSNLG